MLSIKGLDVFYDKAQALYGINLKVESGELVSIIGPNGAGKTTLLDTISGFKDYSGEIIFQNSSLQKVPPKKIVHLGIIHCPERRNLFPFLSVHDNLALGAYRRRDANIAKDLERVYNLFPILKEKDHQLSRTLSGGQQQMLALGRALMGAPKLLLLDEPSFGLAPVVRKAIFHSILEIMSSGVNIFLSEQNASFAFELSQRIYLLETGRIVREGKPLEFAQDKHIQKSYLGI